MANRERLASNIIANILQSLISAGLLFALYRHINTTLGIDQLGVWAVVLATVSASRLADFGLGAGVIRFVARDLAHGKIKRAARIIDTAALTLAASVGLALPLLYPLLARLMPHLFEATHLTQALAILPYALISLWLIIIATVFQGGLDGCQRMDLRAGLLIAGQILLLVLAIWLIPQYGLIGLAWAQIGQGLFLIIGGRLLLNHLLPPLPPLPSYWRWSLLKEMLSYGINVQAATLFMLMLDPVAKAMMAVFGGPAAAGYFEMANQIVLKARSVIVTANKAIVPHVATQMEHEANHLTSLYQYNMRILVFVVLPVFALLFAWAGGLSWLLVGTFQSEFVFLLGALILAWSTNTFASPAYFSNMGTGHVATNTITHAIIGALNIGLGWLLGSYFGAKGVVIAYAISLAIGSGILILIFRHEHAMAWNNKLIREHLGLILACAIVVTFSWLVPLRPSASEPAALIAALLIPLVLLGLSLWRHPLRQQLWNSLAAGRIGT